MKTINTSRSKVLTTVVNFTSEESLTRVETSETEAESIQVGGGRVSLSSCLGIYFMVKTTKSHKFTGNIDSV